MSGERPDCGTIRAASDAIDAYCVASPAPTWPTLPEGVTAADFTEIWFGTLKHDPAGGWLVDAGQFGPPFRGTTVSYLTQADVDAWHAALTDRQRQAIDAGARSIAEATGIDAEYLRDALVGILARNGNAERKSDDGHDT